MDIIYCICNRVNGKRYIGRTSRGFDHRYYKGQWWKYTCSPSLRAAARKHGREAFEVSVLWRGESKAECVLKEVELIKSHGSLYPNGYNHTDRIAGAHWRHESLFNNNSRQIYTLLNMKTGDLYTSDSLTNIGSKVGYATPDLSSMTEGRQMGNWRLVEVREKRRPWLQKYILWNVKTKRWAYDTYSGLYALLSGDGVCQSSIPSLIEGESKRAGDWVLYRNRDTWQRRKLKRASRSYTLIGPDGVTTTIEHMPLFCRQRNLDYQSMMKMVGGVRESFHGWRRIDSQVRHRPIDVIRVTHADGRIALCKTTSEAINSIGCSIGTLYRLFDGISAKAYPGISATVSYQWAA